MLLLACILCLGDGSGVWLAKMETCSDTFCTVLVETRETRLVFGQPVQANWGRPRRLQIPAHRLAPPFLRSTRIVLLSCNRLADSSTPDVGMFRELAALENVRLTVHLGDQVYLDRVHRAFGNATQETEELDEAIRNAYRQSWIPIRKALTRSENIMLPDDHDFLNNIADVASHGDAYTRAAMRWYQVYQTPPSGSSDNLLVTRIINRVALATLDIRLWRIRSNAQHSLYNPEDFHRLKGFLRNAEKDADVDTVVIATQYPLLYINAFIARLVERFDGERYPLNGFAEDVERLFELFESELKSTSLILVGGDHHHYARATIRSTKSDFACESIVTSGMTVESTSAHGNAGSLLFLATSYFPPSLGHFVAERPRELFLGMNFVVLDTLSGKIEPVLGPIENLSDKIRQNLTLISGRHVFGVIMGYILIKGVWNRM